MKKIAMFVVLGYLVLFAVLTLPVLMAAFWPEGGNIHKLLEVFTIGSYWVFIVVMLLCQAGLLVIPVKVAAGRPVSKTTVWLPIIVSGFLAGLLFIGVIYAMAEFIFKEAGLNGYWLLALGTAVAIWIAWGFVFCRMASGKNPRDVVSAQCRLLLHGSIVTLLVAVPTHIVARHRDYCCAGFLTFTGIAFGLSVMLLSFGPGIFFLYVERWRRLHPNKCATNPNDDPHP